MLGKGLRWLVVVVALAVGWLVWACWRDLARARERVVGRSSILASPLGDIEYTQGGAGLPVLVIHGSGGGFDQGGAGGGSGAGGGLPVDHALPFRLSALDLPARGDL